MNIVLHPRTQTAIDDYIARPAHALLIAGRGGSGKGTVGRHITAALLGLPDTAAAEENQYVRIVRPVETKSVTVEAIREVQKFLALKPAVRTDGIHRVILIEQADTMTSEAQNALLKTLEEPPEDTVIILLADAAEAMLPTVRSRSRIMHVLPPQRAAMHQHFTQAGYGEDEISKALLLAGELPGLAAELLEQKTEHSLSLATTHARGILQSKTYERLLLVDSLSKQKQLAGDILFVLIQMARASLAKTSDAAVARRWTHILRTAYTAEQQLAHNAQTKLVMTNLMLSL